MIITECPHCDEPHTYHVPLGQAGPHILKDCSECDEQFVVEITRGPGTTYPKEQFESEVLPELPDHERVDHPEGDVTLYCDPEQLRWAE